MDNKSSWSSCAFELEDIEIIDHKNGNEEKAEKKWHCDQCSLFFLEKGKLDEHKKKHNKKETVNCKYCDKIISVSEGNKASLVNRKCETCEYKCSKCPRRFLRHSSLVNHEKKHSSPKKKKDLCNNKKVNGVCPENGAVSKGVKRKLSEIDDSEEEIKALKKTKKILIVQKSQKKKLHSQVGTQAVSDNENPSIKSPKRLSTKEIKLEEKTNNCEDSPNKVNKRLSFKGDKQSNEKHSPVKSKLTAVNPQAVSTPPNVSSTSSENVVNYKPFSCHVCGDTFASDGALLGHIKTHGENAAKSFKCKFCGDEFDDIYKMQYHLAICPLAEDELESSLKQVLPVSKPMTFSAPPLSPRKRGRPKRLVESPSTEENESTQSPLNNRSVRKRRSVIPELNEMGQTTITSKQPRKSSNFQKSSVSGSNRVGGENVNDTLSSDITEVSKNNEPDDDRKKLHQCPFPRCDFKFTREKALLCHMRNHSDDFDDSLKCHKCDIPFEDIHALRLHINMCKGIKEEKDDDFNRAKSYDSSPNRTFQRAMKKDFVCNQCGRSYQSQEKLNRHLESCGSKFVCRICKDDFLNQPLLDEHFGSNHPPYTAYHCYICEEDFISELFLQIHQADEHGQYLNNKPEQDCAREKSPMSPQKSDLEIHAVSENVPKKIAKKNKSSTKASSSRFVERVSINTRKTGRYSNKIPSSPVNVPSSRIQSSYLFSCPICLQSFVERDNLRIHLRENHVAKSNSIFSCEICEMKMPNAEMMCYHLEIHSSNPLSVNRFSKLLGLARQNIVDEMINPGVKIKQEDETPDSDPLRISKAHKEECSKKASVESKKSKDFLSKSQRKTKHDPTQASNQNPFGNNVEFKEYNFPISSRRKNKKSSNEDGEIQVLPHKEESSKKAFVESKKSKDFLSKSQRKTKYDPTQASNQNPFANDVELVKEYNIPISSRRKTKNSSNKDGEISVLPPVENVTIIGNSNHKTVPEKDGDEIKLSRSRRLKASIDYSFPKKAGKRDGRQKVKIEKIDDESGIESQLVEKKYVKDSSNILGLIEVEAKENYSALNQQQHNTKTQPDLNLRTDEHSKTSLLDKSNQPNTEKEWVHPENIVKPEISIDVNREKVNLVNDDKSVNVSKTETIVSGELKISQSNIKRSKKRRYVYTRPKKTNKNPKNKIDAEPSNQLWNETILDGENKVATERLSSDPDESEVIIPLSYINEAIVDKKSESNFEAEEKSAPTPTHEYEQNNSDLLEKASDDFTKDLDNNLQSEDLAKLPVDTITEPSSDTGVQVQEESTSSSLGESEEICCTMCSERFHNQDILLDHLATHI